MSITVSIPIKYGYLRNFLLGYRINNKPITELPSRCWLSHVIKTQLKKPPVGFLPMQMTSEKSNLKFNVPGVNSKNLNYNFYLSNDSVNLVNRLLSDYFIHVFFTEIMKHGIPLNCRKKNVIWFMEKFNIDFEFYETLEKKYYRIFNLKYKKITSLF